MHMDKVRYYTVAKTDYSLFVLFLVTLVSLFIYALLTDCDIVAMLLLPIIVLFVIAFVVHYFSDRVVRLYV